METGKGYVFRQLLLVLSVCVCDWPCFSSYRLDGWLCCFRRGQGSDKHLKTRNLAGNCC